MRIEGNRYRYENGVIFKGENEVCFLQIGDDREYLGNRLESIKPNENFTYEEIVDMILDTYDY